MAKRDQLVALGVIVGAHGVRGELRVKPYNPDSDLLLELGAVVLRPAERSAGREVALRGARRHGEGLLLTIEGCSDRDAAQALRGSELCLTRAQLPEPGEGEHYLVDLIGLHARLPSGEPVGEVTDVVQYPASQVLVVRTTRGALEVPLAERYVPALRLDEGTAIVDHLDELEVEPGRRRQRPER
jgi:16S rRNA processing protein RimM